MSRLIQEETTVQGFEDFSVMTQTHLTKKSLREMANEGLHYMLTQETCESGVPLA